MINLDFFKDLLEKYSLYNTRRHELIKLSSDALRLSKQAIFALHRDQSPESEKLLKEADQVFGKLEEFCRKDPDLRTEGSYLAAVEEYVEASLFGNFLAGKGVNFLERPWPIGYDQYLSGICDLTGELTRKAIIDAGRGKYQEVRRIHQIIQDIVAQIVKFDLVGHLRVKYDEAKRNLKKMEEIVYDLQIRGHQ